MEMSDDDEYEYDEYDEDEDDDVGFADAPPVQRMETTYGLWIQRPAARGRLVGWTR